MNTIATPQTDSTPRSTYDNAAVAAIAFALQHRDIDLLRLWNEGEFDQIRKEWPDAPEAMFVGADPLYPSPKGAGEQKERGAQACVSGELMEIGDDESGQPRLVIHSTRDEIRNGGLIPFQPVHVVAIAPAQVPTRDVVGYGCRGPTGIHFIDIDRDECIAESRRDGSLVVPLVEQDTTQQQAAIDLAALQGIREQLASESAAMPATSYVGVGLDRAVKALDDFFAQRPQS